MAVLIIGPKENAEIAAAIEPARKHPLPLGFVRASAISEPKDTVTLANRKPGA
jgi:hypothetical protein